MRGGHSFVFYLPALVVLVACGSGGSVPGDAIDFVVCSQFADWERPSEAQQRAEVWSAPRHAGTDVDRLREILDESFFNWHGGNSEMFDTWPLHGLWTADDVERLRPCDPGNGLFTGRRVQVYLLNHRAVEVRLQGSTFDVVAERVERGFESIEFANTLYGGRELPFRFDVRVVTPDGEELYIHELCASDDKTVGCG